VPHLSAALDRLELTDSTDLMANHSPIELEAAIQDLGGELTPAQSQKVSRARAAGRLNSQRIDALLKQAVGRADLESSTVPGARALLAEPRPARAARKVGRNDPCPCGSGKKYKKCCL
jgi:preprotein translocase subunit SecA